VAVGGYASRVKQIATLKAGQVAAKLGENAPLAASCCNACRTCVQTNVIGIALGALAFVAAPVRRRLKHSESNLNR
jgi:exosortase/archaeosortase